MCVSHERLCKDMRLRLCVSGCAPSTAMCICVRLQDLNEKPSKAAPKYIQQARVALLKKAASGQVVTWRMLRTETQRLYRLDYKAWHKRVQKMVQRANDENDNEVLLAELGFRALNVESWSPPPPNSPPRAHSSLQLARSPSSYWI